MDGHRADGCKECVNDVPVRMYTPSGSNDLPFCNANHRDGSVWQTAVAYTSRLCLTELESPLVEC